MEKKICTKYVKQNKTITLETAIPVKHAANRISALFCKRNNRKNSF